MMKSVKQQHFFPEQGEYAFLCAHAQLARGIGNITTSIFWHGTFLGEILRVQSLELFSLCREELEEVMKLVKPQHFLPVHGEYAFLCAHAQLARDIGINDTSVIRNGAFLGVAPKRNNNTVSTGSMQVLGDAKLQLFYNDGNKVRHLQTIWLSPSSSCTCAALLAQGFAVCCDPPLDAFKRSDAH